MKHDPNLFNGPNGVYYQATHDRIYLLTKKTDRTFFDIKSGEITRRSLYFVQTERMKEWCAVKKPTPGTFFYLGAL